MQFEIIFNYLIYFYKNKYIYNIIKVVNCKLYVYYWIKCLKKYKISILNNFLNLTSAYNIVFIESKILLIKFKKKLVRLTFIVKLNRTFLK